MNRIAEIKERLQTEIYKAHLADEKEDIKLYDIQYLLSRLEIAEKALEEIGAKHEPPASKIANDALWDIKESQTT